MGSNCENKTLVIHFIKVTLIKITQVWCIYLYQYKRTSNQKVHEQKDYQFKVQSIQFKDNFSFWLMCELGQSLLESLQLLKTWVKNSRKLINCNFVIAENLYSCAEIWNIQLVYWTLLSHMTSHLLKSSKKWLRYQIKSERCLPQKNKKLHFCIVKTKQNCCVWDIFSDWVTAYSTKKQKQETKKQKQKQTKTGKKKPKQKKPTNKQKKKHPT